MIILPTPSLSPEQRVKPAAKARHQARFYFRVHNAHRCKSHNQMLLAVATPMAMIAP